MSTKCLGINLTKEAKGACNGNFKSLEEGIEKDIGRYVWTGMITIGKWIYYKKQSADPAPSSLNFQNLSSLRQKQYIVASTFMGKQKYSRATKAILSKNNHGRGLTVPTSYLSYRATVTKMS